ncbi:hypothetical protein C8R44DRAFT_172905 [Mycena epipterygia]|nr:hypothetical protein C8R44DRAFT_172905 [Mycena epipterygia]
MKKYSSVQSSHGTAKTSRILHIYPIRLSWIMVGGHTRTMRTKTVGVVCILLVSREPFSEQYTMTPMWAAGFLRRIMYSWPDAHQFCTTVLIDWIRYQLSFSGPSENLPEGYLFLCPLEDLRDVDGTFLRNPECPGYWSLNPSGIQRLSPEEASSLGFPSLVFKMKVLMRSWPKSVYAALSHFHAAKDSIPIVKMSPSTLDTPFTSFLLVRTSTVRISKK